MLRCLAVEELRRLEVEGKKTEKWMFKKKKKKKKKKGWQRSMRF